MFAKTYGATTLGIDGRIIDVEVDVSPGLPGFELVGLPDTSVKESKERVTVHLAQSYLQNTEVGFWYSPQFSIKSRNTFHKWRKIANKKHHSNQKEVQPCVC